MAVDKPYVSGGGGRGGYGDTGDIMLQTTSKMEDVGRKDINNRDALCSVYYRICIHFAAKLIY
ncbi:hypothetical protein C5167_014584 [Papaver somniferum]|uniref:Uncharacterized protein n=1 Tax=Papaver somniferum TaxID=3469 RepID=A0A4Y7J5K0_PAPSO|nr:hypothetical protein C5167_014584 [Papaver somniferum]